MMKTLILISIFIIISSGCVRTKSTEVSLNETEGSLKIDDNNKSIVLPEQSVSLIWSINADQPSTLNLQASTDSGKTWQNIQTSIPNSGLLNWQITLDASQFQLRLVGSEDSTLIAALSHVIRVDHIPVANNIVQAVTEAALSTVYLSYTDADSDLASTCLVTPGANINVSTPCFCVAGLCAVRILSEEFYSGAASFTYTVTANAQVSNTATASLTIVAANHAPSNISLSAASLAENAGSNTVIGNLSSTDPDSGDTFTYSLVLGTGSTDNTSFNISGNQLRENASLDFENKNSYSIRVRTTDAGGLYFEKQFTISITNVNEAPIASDITPSAGFVATAKSITLSYSDPENDQATSCVLSNLTNVIESTACACGAGICTVGITSSAEGAVSFDYTVTASGLTSNTAHVSFSSVVGLSISDLTVDEWGVATLNVNLSAASASPITVDYSTSDVGGTAQAGTDYIARNTTLTIPAGVSTKAISIPVTSNQLKEGGRFFYTNLINPTNAGLISSSAKISITDNELYSPLNGVSKTALGDNFACVLLTTGAVKCWGNNTNGQIGDNTSGTNRLIPTDVSGLGSGVTAISAGSSHACALLSSGGVKCWGYNANGQIGDNTSGTNRLIPTDVFGLSSGVIAISAGSFHACALLTSGEVKCWGSNTYGQIGDNTSGTNRLVPTTASGLTSGVQSIDLGGNHSCAFLTSGALKCWGRNNYGQIGDNTSGTNRLIPTDVSGLSSGVVAVSAGSSHTCALLSTGGAKCWGYNAQGQIGDNTSGTNRLIPTDVSGLSSGVTAISAGSPHTCAVLSTGTAKCWGSNDTGLLGDGTSDTNSLVPTDTVAMGANVSEISAGVITCALLTTGSVKCWGNNSSGRLGRNIDQTSVVATDISTLAANVVQVSVSHQHACAVFTSGGVKCWGDNSFGQLGIGANGSKMVPTDVAGLTTGVQMVATGTINLGFDSNSCVVLTSGAAKCWGQNTFGEVGDGTFANVKYNPTDVSGLSSGVSKIVTSGSHSCAVLTSGAAKCWGLNSSGELGDNTTAAKFVPTDVSGLGTGVIDIAVSEGNTCALLTTGAVKCWGNNSNGQVGDNTSGTNRLVPTDVSGLSSGVSAIKTGSFSACALLTSGAVKCWGSNSNGQIGDNTSGTNRLVPTDVSSMGSGVAAIAMGRYHSCALLSTGGVRCWGNNGSGQIGDNTIATNRLVPTNVSNMQSGAVALAAGGNRTCALLVTGSVKCWGDNSYFGEPLMFLPDFVVSP